ncbi:class I SAM-dependent methyltransferase [bacterium]|nr:class I SAM-dependent methyltransferase [bacterium]
MQEASSAAPESSGRTRGRTMVGRIGERAIDTEYWRSEMEYALYLAHVAQYEWASAMCAGARVCEMGCGFGYGAALISQVAEQVVGIDVDPTLVEQLQELANEKMQFLFYDGCRAPVPDNSVDVCLSIHVIEHVAAPGSFLREQKRIVRPGGHVLLVTPNGARRLLPGQRPWNPYHLREYTPDTLKRLMEAEFGSIELQGFHYGPRVAKLQERKLRMRRSRALQLVSAAMPGVLWRGLLRGVGLLRSWVRSTQEPVHPAEDFSLSASDFSIRDDADGADALLATARVPES